MIPTLALDLGTSLGYAFDAAHGGLVAGTIELATPKEVTKWKRERLLRRTDPRAIRCFRWLRKTVQDHNIRRIVFEDVEFCSQTYQCQLWASLRTCVWIMVFVEPVPYIEAVPVMTLKKFATGTGKATKSMMAAALISKCPGRFSAVGCRKDGQVKDEKTKSFLDNNAVDALWLYRWAEENCR